MLKLEDPEDPAYSATKKTFVAILSKKNDLLSIFLDHISSVIEEDSFLIHTQILNEFI